MSSDALQEATLFSLLLLAALTAAGCATEETKKPQAAPLARNGDTDGAGGALDRPSEVCVRRNRLYISNIDLPYGGNEYDAPRTISVLDLD